MSRPTEAITQGSPTGAARRRAGHLAGSLMLGAAARVLGFLATLPWLAHAGAVAWPTAAGELLARTVMTQYVNHKAPSDIVRDS